MSDKRRAGIQGHSHERSTIAMSDKAVWRWAMVMAMTNDVTVAATSITTTIIIITTTTSTTTFVLPTS